MKKGSCVPYQASQAGVMVGKLLFTTVSSVKKLAYGPEATVDYRTHQKK